MGCALKLDFHYENQRDWSFFEDKHRTEYIYDEASQLLKEDYQFVYNYDLNGNLLSKISKDSSKDSFSYTYSSTNQLTSVRSYQYVGDPIKMQVDYQYDVLGRRIQKKVIDNRNSAKSFVKKYIYNGENIFAELNGNNQVEAVYTHSPLNPDDILEAEITHDGVQGGLASSPGKYQFLKDVIGTVIDITDSDGNVIQRYNYTAFGKIRSIKDGSDNDITGSPIVNTAFAFTGREHDFETGLYYYRARYYDPAIGRFLQSDPAPGRMLSPITFNKYVYAGNNPMLFTDSTGKDFWTDVGKAVVIVCAIVVGFYVGAAFAAYMGISGLAAIIPGMIAGGAAGAVVGGAGYELFGVGTFEEGAKIGAIAGGIAGGFGGYFSQDVGFSFWDNYSKEVAKLNSKLDQWKLPTKHTIPKAYDLELASKYGWTETVDITTYFFNIPHISAEFSRYVVAYVGLPALAAYIDNQVNGPGLSVDIISKEFR